MVTELFVRNGSYSNLPKGHEYERYLTRIDTPTLEGSKKYSAIAKKKAIKYAKQMEKLGWKLVTIRAIYSYGNNYPYGYEVSSWGGVRK